MNTAQLKAYAPKARREFIQAVTERAGFYGLSKDRIEPVEVRGNIALIGGKEFPAKIKEQRQKLEERIKSKGFDQFMEAAAYTWFNRFVALRYMEIHGYLNHGLRVLSHPDGGMIPEILEKAADVELPGLKKDAVIDLKLHGGKDDELYRMLLVAQCHALNHAMPFLFERIDDETELLMPVNLLHTDSLIRKLVSEIDEAEWQEVEIIGWIYQFYISEKKDEVIGKVVKSEDIPAATQLFTPKWIVKYLVQNTLGQQWLMSYPDSPLKSKMEYYIEPAEQTIEVKKQLAEIIAKELLPEEITVFDPACGSGHILVEAYDLLKEIYLERGYRLRDIPKLILEKNLFGLDIDDRAAQLAGFALMMKARADDRNVLNGGEPVNMNVLSIQSSDGIDAKELAEVLLKPRRQRLVDSNELFPETERQQTLAEEYKPAVSKDNVSRLLELYKNGKTFGSLISIPDELAKTLSAIDKTAAKVRGVGDLFADEAADTLMPFVKQSMLLATKYDHVIINPPYMGGRYMNQLLKNFAKEVYPEAKHDAYSLFTYHVFNLTKNNGYIGMVSPFTWMFISTFEPHRKHILSNSSIISLVKPSYTAFFESAIVPLVTFVLRKSDTDELGHYFDLGYLGSAENQPIILREAIVKPSVNYRYKVKKSDLYKIPGCPIAYSVSNKVRQIFQEGTHLKEIAEPRQGLATTANARFLRRWYEISYHNIGFGFNNKNEAILSQNKWFPYNKGGEFRKWFGNNDFIVNYKNDGEEIKTEVKEKYRETSYAQGFSDERWDKLIEVWVVKNQQFYFLPSVTWSFVSSSFFGVRKSDKGYIFDVGGSSLFPGDDNLDLYTGFLCSKVVFEMMKTLNPTLNFQVGNVGTLPVIKEVFPKIKKEVDSVVEEAVQIARQDWDSFETSWDFKIFPMLSTDCKNDTVETSFNNWLRLAQTRISRMKELETKNNRIFIEAYDLQDEMSPEVSDEEITLAKADREADIKRLLSYSIGCMMGRYSLDQTGLIYAESASNNFDTSKYITFPADEDGIVPVLDMDWFPDDATNRFIEFLKVVWSPATMDENIKFVADCLSPKQDETKEGTIRRYFSTGFFKDHINTYRKRPIYWLFSSGKQKAFQCLVYLHRYNEGTLSRMRSEYVTPLQGKINARIGFLEKEIENAASTSAKTKFRKQLETVRKKQAELSVFDDELRHYADKRIAIDLDDGVKVNYGKFGKLLAEVKAVTGGTEE